MSFFGASNKVNVGNSQLNWQTWGRRCNHFTPPPPSLYHCYVLRVVNAAWSYIEKKEIETRILGHISESKSKSPAQEGHTLTDYANPCSSLGCTKAKSCLFLRETRIEETSLFTFLAISSPTLSVATSSNGPLHVEYNIRSLMEHLYPGIEYTNTARQHNHVDGGAAHGQR